MAGKVVFFDLEGKKLVEVTGDANGNKFTNPNDITADGEGGVIISDPGPFAEGSEHKGRIFHISKDKKVTLVHSGLIYPNGVAFNPTTRRLLVSEHLGRAIWGFALDEEWRTAREKKILDSTQLLKFANNKCGLKLKDWPKYSGPDGIRVHNNKTIFVAMYGLGSLLLVDEYERLGCISVPFQYPTSMAFSQNKIAITGTDDIYSTPLSGVVMIDDLSNYLK